MNFRVEVRIILPNRYTDKDSWLRALEIAQELESHGDRAKPEYVQLVSLATEDP